MNDLSLEGRVEALADEFLARRRAGERPTPEEYAARHPDIAALIRDVFPALALLEECGPASDATTPERIGDFRILRQIGAGGMGVVYEALEVSLGRHVALKVLPRHPPPAPAAVERFRREARAAAGLHHPHIVPVFGVGEHEGLPFCVMQYIRGQNLADVLRDVRGLRRGEGGSSSAPARGLIVGTFSASAATRPEAVDTRADGVPPAPADDGVYFQSVARLGAEAAEGLDHAHRQGVLHRDVKPSNLLLDAAGTVWVADFGLAKVDGMDDLTGTGDVVGTLRYLPPERLSGKADARGDVYGLGLTLYEMATLRPAFGDVDRAQMLDLIRHASPPAPREIDRRVPRDLETILLKAIDKEPARRYQSAGEMADDLRRFLAGDPIRARPVGPVGHAWRWARRRPAVAALIATVTLLLLTSTAGGLWLWRTAEGALAETKEALTKEEKSRRVAERAMSRHGVHLAGRELDAGRVARAAELLEDVPSGLRRWEWHHLRLRCNQEAGSFPSALATLVSYTDGGRALAVRLVHGPVAVLDAGSGKELRRVDAPPSRPAVKLGVGPEDHRPDRIRSAFSPDGRLFACVEGDLRVVVFDLRTGAVVCRLEHPAAQGLAFTPDGRRLLVGAWAGRTTLWDVGTARAVRTYPAARVLAVHPGGALAAMQSPAPGSGGPTRIRVVDLRTGATRYEMARSAASNLVAFSGVDGLAMPAAGGIRLVDGRPGNDVAWWVANGGPFDLAVLSPDGRRMASAGSDWSVRIWDARSRRLRQTLRGHLAEITWLAFRGDGEALVTASLDGTVKMWRCEPDTGEWQLSGGPQEYVTAAGPDGRRALWVDQAGARLRVAGTRGETLWSMDGPGVAVTALTWAPSGGLAAGALAGGTLACWDLDRRQEVWRAAGAAHLGPMAFSPDGLLVASVALEGDLQVRHARTGRPAWVAPAGLGRGRDRLAWSADGAMIAWSDSDGLVRVFEAQGGREVWRKGFKPLSGAAVAFIPGARRLAVGEPGGVVVHNLDGGAARRIPTGDVHGLAFNPDGGRMATSGREEAVRLWDVADGRQVLDLPFRGGSADLRFTGDGRLLQARSVFGPRWVVWEGGR